MVIPKQLDSGGSEEAVPIRRSTRKTRPSRRPYDEGESQYETNKKKKTNLGSPVNRIWSHEDELIVLKGFVEFRAERENESKVNWDSFYRFIGSPINGKFSKEQVVSKVRKLRKRFLDRAEEIRRENAEAFGYSMILWGQTEGESCAETGQEAQQRRKGKELLEEDNEAGKRMEIETIGKETQDDDDDLGTLLDAFETMLSSGISDYHRKWQLEKLMNLETGIKSKLSNEWTSLCDEEIKLKMKMLLFSAKLVEAASES